MTVKRDNSLSRHPADPRRIDVNSRAELRYWARELSRPPSKLGEAIAAVGPLVCDVRDYLRKHSLYGKLR